MDRRTPEDAERRQFFCDESGIGPDSQWLAVGMLSTTADSRRALRARIDTVRTELGFVNELHSEKLSPLREQVYRRLLETTLDLVEYRAIVARRSDVALDRFGRQWYIALNFLTRRMVEHFVRPGLDAVLFLDFKTRAKRDNGLEYLFREVNLAKPGSLRAVEALDSKDSDLLQLSDLYLGWLRLGYEWGWPLRLGPEGMPPADTRKRRLYADFVRVAWERRKRSRFRVWEWQPPK